MSRPRRSGILLPLFALPSRYGIGDMGPEALRFADFLRDAAQTVWQVLPLTAIDGGCGNSPYSPTSAFAGNPLLISPEALADSGLIGEADLADAPAFDDARVDYDRVRAFKDALLRRAWSNFKRAGARSRYERFFADNRHWLEGYSFFAAIKGCRGGQPWYEWPEDLKFRRHEALHRTWMEMADEIEFHRFVQFLFSSQMGALRSRLSDLGICLVGDVPVYVTRDCADVWLHPHLFELDEELAPVSVAGVPPDYFSPTGQLWGNPLYNWDAMLAEDFRWWMERLRHLLTFFDRVRIDHFRGLVGYWSLPADARTAEAGRWRSAPHERFFEALCRNFPTLPFWAENLGILTPEIETLRRNLGLPGMLVLHFAFGDPARNPYAPHNHTPVNVIYTGTHDNNTSLGWFEEDASSEEIANLSRYLGHEVNRSTVVGEMVRMAMSSVAETAVVPMQDHLELGSSYRTNIPATPSGNWTWRMMPGQADKRLASHLRELTEFYGRA